ncbi:Spc7 kinetochore protein-domain-containing protein [Crepidotus variabilis]|uniref:Spc7 kinetochore protein-domain-containing protein n=1 Tax=Crepidotus variabilis TaxID=179855 RepID=A0A9P6EV70_9AGAR|nr:Spc7 kinetochore protein-domain-containing protein [Crepidotus variabilis]
MASLKKVSPNRRRSVGVFSQNQPSLVPKNRRRAHSIVPGALSPLAKARRSLAPRKSILKSSVNVLNLEPSSQQSTTTEDTNATRSMDITQEFSAPVHDNTSRKSFGRRVSFASHSQVRMFETSHTNSTGSPQSSPSSVSSPDAPQHPTSNENDYPGQSSRRRRSSVRFSMAGSEDMDMTTVINPTNFQRGSAILNEELSYDEEEFNDMDDDDMDVTQAIHGNFIRKQSLSMGRQPLSQLETGTHTEDEANDTRSDIGDESLQSEGVSEDPSQAMEFTVPLGHSLKPAEKDEVWLALKKMTHSGDEINETEQTSDDSAFQSENNAMDLDDAMERLKRARDSLPHTQPYEEPNDVENDTFTSTEDSFENDLDGNKTLNLSQVMGRISLSTNARMSLGYPDSNMDESEIYGNIAQLTPRQSLSTSEPPIESEADETPQPEPSEPEQQPSKPSVFQPPPPTSVAPPSPSPPTFTRPAKPAPTGPFTFTPQPQPLSPSKAMPPPSASKIIKPKATFSAAFAPPVNKPSPKKASMTSLVQPSPAKRPRPQEDDSADAERPSPAKKQALVNKWLGVAGGSDDATRTSPIVSATKPTPKPAPLPPSKKAPFQAPAPSESSRPVSAIRRPSGYFARRKSLAVGFNTPLQEEPAPLEAPSPPKKAAGRMSLGAGPSDAWQRFDKNAGSGMPERPTSISPKKVGSMKETEAEHCVRETSRQAAASPSPTRGSPAPAHIFLPPQPRTPSPERQVVPIPETNGALSVIAEGSEHEGLSQDMAIDVEATQQWRDGVEEPDFLEEDLPQISIGQFFQMTGIKFMDELTAPRRSLHPGSQSLRQPRNIADIPLAEYVTAMAIDVPQLDLYSRVSKDLEGWMQKSKVVFAEAEEEAEKVTPELFVEYARADEEGQAELMHQLNLIRTHTRYLARSDWYDWKHQWVEGLRLTAEEAFVSLENDARTLESLKKETDAVLPDLENEYAELMRELEQEEAEVKEIESSDQDYLNDLKASIAEQNIEIEALKAELSEANEQSSWIQDKLTEVDTQKREAQNTINTAERVLRMKQTSTRSEVFRLKGDLEALEDLHMFRITKVNANVFEYVYASLFLVSIPCKNFTPVVTKVNITRHGKESTRTKDDFPKLSSFLLATAKYLINESEDLTVRQIVNRLNDYWSSCSQLRSQLTLLNVKYPVDIILPSSSKEITMPSFKAKTTVMFPSVQGKAFVSFKFSFDTITQWPLTLEALDCDVDVSYGSLDRSTVMKAVMDRLSQATPAENYACLLDACIEAQDVYH